MPVSNTCVIIDEKPIKQNVKICRQCLKNTEIDIKQSGHYKWSTHCFCKNCNFDWFECIHHPTTGYMKTTKQLKTDELNKMKKHEMIEWLKDRDLETDGVSSQLKERIVNKITMKQDRNNKIFTIVEPLVLSLYGLLSRAMTDKVDEKLVRETKRYSLF